MIVVAVSDRAASRIMKKTVIPNDVELKVIFDSFKQELINGWSTHIAQRKSGISQKLDLILDATNLEYKEIKKKYYNKKPGRPSWQYNDYLNKIEKEKKEFNDKIERMEALKKSELPFGIRNINLD